MRKIVSILAACLALLCAGSGLAYAQNGSVFVSGVVTDETGLGLPGVAVVISGTTKGVVTDSDGKYSLDAPANAELAFRFVGYKEISEKISGRRRIDVRLQPDTKVLDEVVVVGYGTMKKSDLTGSVSSISSKSIESFKTASVAGALGGQIAGVSVVSADGTPGAGYEIRVRGIGTVNGDATPLFVVDGFEVDGIDNIASQDIASIEVLKDASASAIYGARAANGVILVTTKSGREGKTNVTYNGSASYRMLSKHIDVLSPYEYVELQMESNPVRYNGLFYNYGDDFNGNPYRYQTMDDYKNVAGLDWQSLAFRPTWSQTHDLSITGGSKQTKYLASFSHFDEEGIFANSGFVKNNFRFKINQQLYKWLTLDANFSYADTEKTGMGTGGYVLSNVIMYRPTGGLYTSDYALRYNAVDPIMQEVGLSNTNYYNPILNAEHTDVCQARKMWGANAALSFRISRQLGFKSSVSYTTSSNRNDWFYHKGSQNADYQTGPYGISQMYDTVRWGANNVLNYFPKFNGRIHRASVTLGQEISFNSSEVLKAESKDFPIDDLGVNNLGLGATPSEVSSSFTDKRRLSFFARAFYSYKERYMLTATMRADASSVFSQKNKWGYFPSFAFAWNLAKEDWMKNLDFLTNAKLRLGWGIVGNDNIANYLSMRLYTDAKYGLGSKMETVLYPAQLANEELKWEGAETINLGLDLGIFNDRVNLVVDAFVKNSRDLLLSRNLAFSSGFDSQWQNIGQIRNRGLEFTLNTININKRNFSWKTDFNISFVKNTLISLADGTDYILSRSGLNSTFSSYDYIAKVGEPIGNMYGYVFDGIYQYSDFKVAPDGTMVLREGVPDMSEHAGESMVPGFVKYKDIDGDGIITADDRTIIGNGQPDWYGGITNTFKIGPVDFGFMFQFTYGNDVYNAQRMWGTQTRMEMYNMYSEVRDRWSVGNASNLVPSVKGYVAGDVYSRFVEDGSFLRLKNLSVGYTLPRKYVKNAKIRVYAIAENLWCLTAYNGYDPEVNCLSSNLMPSYDFGAYPRAKVMTIGAELAF